MSATDWFNAANVWRLAYENEEIEEVRVIHPTNISISVVFYLELNFQDKALYSNQIILLYWIEHQYKYIIIITYIHIELHTKQLLIESVRQMQHFMQ